MILTINFDIEKKKEKKKEISISRKTKLRRLPYEAATKHLRMCITKTSDMTFMNILLFLRALEFYVNST